jgi:hypothetical protein
VRFCKKQALWCNIDPKNGHAKVEILHKTEWTDRKNRFTIWPMMVFFHLKTGFTSKTQKHEGDISPLTLGGTKLKLVVTGIDFGF